MSGFELVTFILGAILMVIGIFFYIVQFIGVFKYTYVLNRIHAAALGDTLGSGCVILGAILMNGLQMSTLKMLLIIPFMWLTAPVSTHMLSKMEVLSKKNMNEAARVIVIDSTYKPRKKSKERRQK